MVTGKIRASASVDRGKGKTSRPLFPKGTLLLRGGGEKPLALFPGERPGKNCKGQVFASERERCDSRKVMPRARGQGGGEKGEFRDRVWLTPARGEGNLTGIRPKNIENARKIWRRQGGQGPIIVKAGNNYGEELRFPWEK